MVEKRSKFFKFSDRFLKQNFRLWAESLPLVTGYRVTKRIGSSNMVEKRSKFFKFSDRFLKQNFKLWVESLPPAKDGKVTNKEVLSLMHEVVKHVAALIMELEGNKNWLNDYSKR